ncbi:MAG: type II CAAX endopeptidase family protein [Micropruina sp.]
MTVLVTSTPSTTPAPEALAYFQLSRRTPGWWRPLATIGLFCLTYLVLVVGLIMLWLLLPGAAEAMSATDIDMADPAQSAFLCLMLALFVPAGRLTVRMLGRPGTLDSVAGRFRWGLFVRSVALTAAPVLLPLAVMWVVDPVMPVLSERTLGLLAVAVLIVPLQAAGEEYLFRGVLMQAVGHWLRAPVWGLVISLPLFVLGHDYDAWGLASVGVFAAVATWLTWRTGGLEAAIALHAVNNMLAFTLGAFGIADLNATTTTWADALVSSVIPIGFAAMFDWWWRRGGCRRYSSV